MLPKNRLPTSPDEVLEEEFGITPRSAIKLARATGTSPEFWTNLQTNYERAKADERLAVTLTVRELRALIREELSAATSETDEVLTTEQVAVRFSLHPKTVARLVRVGGMPAHRLGRGRYRFRASEVDAWFAKRGK